MTLLQCSRTLPNRGTQVNWVSTAEKLNSGRDLLYIRVTDTVLSRCAGVHAGGSGRPSSFCCPLSECALECRGKHMPVIMFVSCVCLYFGKDWKNFLRYNYFSHYLFSQQTLNHLFY